MDNNWIYYGIFFNEKTQRLLYDKAKEFIPEGWKTYCHHMTIVFNDKSKEKNEIANALDACIGNHESLMITGVGISDRAIAFSVDYKTQNKVSHITVAIAPGAKPVESNNITNWEPVKPFYVTGTVDKFTKNGNSMKITENDLKNIVSESVKRILKEYDCIEEPITDFEELYDTIYRYVDRNYDKINSDLEKGVRYEDLFEDMWFVTSNYINPFNFGKPGNSILSMDKIKSDALTSFKHVVGEISDERKYEMPHKNMNGFNESKDKTLKEGFNNAKLREIENLDRVDLFLKLLEELGNRKMDGKSIVINKNNVYPYDNFIVFSGNRTEQKITFERRGDLWILNFDGDKPVLLENCPEDFLCTLLLNLDNVIAEGLTNPTEYENDIASNAQSPSQVFKLNNWTYKTESKDNGALILRCYTGNNNSFEMGNFPEFEKVVSDLNKFYKYHGSKSVAEAIPDDGVSRGRLLKIYKTV